jgi:hypothetical protein
MYKKYKLAIFAALTSFALNASSAVIAVESLGYNYNGNVDYLSPVGQEFVAAHNSLDFINIFMSDSSSGEDVHEVYLLLREGGIYGDIVAQSTTIQLEDCFNFIEEPGCGIGGGFSTEIEFSFTKTLINIDTKYTFEIVSAGRSLSVGYYRSGGYDGGSAFFNGSKTADDLWFQVGHIEVPTPTSILLFGSALGLLARNRFYATKDG